jgi:nucleoside transporter
MDPVLRCKLSVMMFLQYAIWGVWAVPMGKYCAETLKFGGSEIGAIYSTTAIAAMISPLFMGFLADRLFATEKLIGVLHLLGAVVMWYASTVTTFDTLFTAMIVYSLCYMPTLALTNSISFANITNPEKEFPGIRVLGTFGWIAAGFIVAYAVNDKTNAILKLASGFSAILGVFAFTLPHTPPRGKQAAVETKVGGQGIGTLLQDPNFLLFTVVSFLICIPLSMYYAFAGGFLGEIEAPRPAALQSIGQMSEVGFMAAMPFFITRLGVKNMLLIGMFAWVARYACFGSLSFPLVVVGLILHGVCYDFFFVASQIYVDNRVSGSQRAAAQSFLAFVTLGLGMYLGSIAGGKIVGAYQTKHPVTATITQPDGTSAEQSIPLPNWDAEGQVGFAKELGLKATATLPLSQLPESISEGGGDKPKTTVSRAELARVLPGVDRNGDQQIDRPEWVSARQAQWPIIWGIPAIMALVTCVIFFLGFKNQAPVAAAESAPAA